VAVSWCGGRGVKKEQVLTLRLGEFWGARAASLQLPAACRQHFATVMWKFA
jgi:hypothetical protein